MVSVPAKKQEKRSVDEMLEEILKHLHNLDRRDRWRTIGGFFRGILGLIPIAITVYAVWYLWQHGDELLAKIAQQAAEQAAIVTSRGTDGLVEQIQQFFPQ